MITSQNATAPKRLRPIYLISSGLITSQNATAPKPNELASSFWQCLITSQNATAPKQTLYTLSGNICLITSQNATAPKHNLAFDGAFIFDFLLNYGWVFNEDARHLRPWEFSATISDMNQVYAINLKFPHGVKIDILDSLKIIPMTIARMAKTFGMPMSKGDIDYTEHREVGHVITDEELDYLKRDVLILSHALDLMLRMGEGLITSQNATAPKQAR